MDQACSTADRDALTHQCLTRLHGGKQAPGTPSTPGTPAKPVPADVKDKIRDLLKSAKDGTIKAGEFSREWEKKYGKTCPYLCQSSPVNVSKFARALNPVPPNTSFLEMRLHAFPSKRPSLR